MSSSQRIKVDDDGPSRSQTDDTLTRLPPEILEKIGEHVVDLRDIESLSKTNKRLKKLMSNSLDKARAEKKRIMNGDACKNRVNFKKIADVWKNDPDVVMRATENDWRALGVASEELRSNPDFMAKAVGHNGLGLQFATQRVKDDEEVVWEAVVENGLALRFASEKVRDDEGVVSEALEENGMALKYASGDLQNSEDFVKIAVTNNGLALEFAGPDPRDNEDIVKLAMQNYKADDHFHLNNPFQYASDRLQNTKAFVMDLIEEDGYYCLMYASDQLCDDYDVMALAIDRTLEKKGDYQAMAPYGLASNRLKTSRPEIRPENPHYYVQNDYVIKEERNRRVKAGIEDEQGNQIFPPFKKPAEPRRL